MTTVTRHRSTGMRENAMDLDFAAFRSNLQALINARGKMKKEVAADVNVTPEAMSRYLAGKRVPKMKYVVRLAKYFNVSVDWFLGLNGDKFDLSSKDIQDFAELYSLASPDDRRVIQVVLSKYKISETDVCPERKGHGGK